VPAAAPGDRPPVEVQAIPARPLESVAPPPAIDSAPKPQEKTPIQEAPPLERAQPRPQERESPRTIERAPPLKEEAAPRASPFRAPPGASTPDITAKPFDPTAPGLDLDALRKRAGEIAREGSGQRAVLPFPMPPPAERKTRMQTAIENARKPDCRTAYQSLGLAAVIPLIANEFGEGNCRW
jgi:hypothetical protein